MIATFTGFEADLLRSLAAQLVELLRSDAPAREESGDPMADLFDFSGPTSEPEDPVLARLLPSAYRDDDEAAADFRRYTESALRDRKVASALAVVRTLQDAGLADEAADEGLVIDVELDEPTAMEWLTAFTDIRLALATRLGVEEGDEEDWEELPETDRGAQLYGIYQWVGLLQETLVDALWRA